MYEGCRVGGDVRYLIPWLGGETNNRKGRGARSLGGARSQADTSFRIQEPCEERVLRGKSMVTRDESSIGPRCHKLNFYDSDSDFRHQSFKSDWCLKSESDGRCWKSRLRSQLLRSKYAIKSFLHHQH